MYRLRVCVCLKCVCARTKERHLEIAENAEPITTTTYQKGNSSTVSEKHLPGHSIVTGYRMTFHTLNIILYT